MLERKTSKYVNDFVKFINLELSFEEGEVLANRIQNVSDSKLASDYLFLVRHRAAKAGLDLLVEEIDSDVREVGLCPSDDLLYAYALGGLRGEELKRYIDEHLEQCNSCKYRVIQYGRRCVASPPCKTP